MNPASSDGYRVAENELLPLAAFLDKHAVSIVQQAERAWETSILLISQLSQEQREQMRQLAVRSVNIWALRLRQSPDYARRVFELGQEWGAQASGWQLHVYSFIKALEILGHTTWEFVAEYYPLEQLSSATVFFLGRSRDQVLDDLRVPLSSTYLQRREVEMGETGFAPGSTLSLPGRSLLLELANRLQANKDRVIPAWFESVKQSTEATEAMENLLRLRGGQLFDLLLSLLQFPTPERSASSLSGVRAIGLASAQAGVSFQEMFHALQQIRPILWNTVYDIYRREQYWHPAEFIEVLARLHLLLDLFSEGIGVAYLEQKEMIIQEQAEELHRRDLNLAREMLEGLLPSHTLELPHTDIGAVWIPAREIGGDFYDIFPLNDDEVMLIIGDVSGKGISASLLVSMVKYILKANAPLCQTPSALLTVANRLFYQDMGPELFVTMFAAMYSPSTGRLVYCSAGHDPCYICHSDKPRLTTLPSTGPILGIIPEIELKDCELFMKSNDILLMYTDGLVNVRCNDHHTISSHRMCGALREHAGLPAQLLVQRMLDATIHACEPTDDITVMIVKRETEGDKNA